MGRFCTLRHRVRDELEQDNRVFKSGQTTSVLLDALLLSGVGRVARSLMFTHRWIDRSRGLRGLFGISGRGLEPSPAPCP